MPSVSSSSRPKVLLSSTVMTPSLPPLSIASAIMPPMALSPAEMEAVAAICSLVSTSLEALDSSSQTASTAASMPFFRPIGLAPAATLRRPSRTSDWARMVAVVVPSPATSLVFFATSLTSSAPIFSYGSSSSISLAMLTPSLVMVGPPHFFSRTTLRPFGPSVTRTASASWFMPRSSPRRASSSNAIIFATWWSFLGTGDCRWPELGWRPRRMVWPAGEPVDRLTRSRSGTQHVRVLVRCLALDPGECKAKGAGGTASCLGPAPAPLPRRLVGTYSPRTIHLPAVPASSAPTRRCVRSGLDAPLIGAGARMEESNVETSYRVARGCRAAVRGAGQQSGGGRRPGGWGRRRRPRPLPPPGRDLPGEPQLRQRVRRAVLGCRPGPRWRGERGTYAHPASGPGRHPVRLPAAERRQPDLAAATGELHRHRRRQAGDQRLRQRPLPGRRPHQAGRHHLSEAGPVGRERDGGRDRRAGRLHP